MAFNSAQLLAAFSLALLLVSSSAKLKDCARIDIGECNQHKCITACIKLNYNTAICDNDAASEDSGGDVSLNEMGLYGSCVCC
ncbi:hypothetical protein ACQJBY_013582 [Aegilops geniculata]